MSVKAAASTEAIGKLKQAGSQGAQKVGEKVASSWESVKARLSDAVSAFSHRFDLELETQRLAREGSEEGQSDSEATIGTADRAIADPIDRSSMALPSPIIDRQSPMVLSGCSAVW